MSGTSMSAGTSASGAVGSSAQVVGNPNSDFFQKVMPVVFAAAVLDVVQDRSNSPGMMPGQGLTAALGASATAYAFGGQQLGDAMAPTLMGLGIMTELFRMGTSSSVTPEQAQQAQIDEQRRLASIEKDDADKARFAAEEEQRRAYFANKGPGM